jgi:hypothetical protein
MNTEQTHHSDQFQLGRRANPQSIRCVAPNFNKFLEDHHIFPNDYLKKNWAEVNQTLDSEVAIDCVVNRTLIPKLTNIKVSNKAPSKYLAEIRAKNPNILKALQSHMLSGDLLSGDYDKNYDYFISERSDSILKAIRTNITDTRSNVLSEFGLA